MNMNQNFLTRDEVKQIAPAVFAKSPSDHLSDRYSFMPSSIILDAMEAKNWGVVGAYQMKSKNMSENHSIHTLRFRPRFDEGTVIEKDQIIPELYLDNNHAGVKSINVQMGLYKVVCSNGLVAAERTFLDMKRVHVALSIDEVSSIIENHIGRFSEIYENVNEYQKIMLTETQKIEFAFKAIEIRYKRNLPSREKARASVFRLITPNRKEDEGDSLWNIFNVVQENLLSGGFKISDGQKNATVRKIKNMTYNVYLNLSLWALMGQFITKK